MQHIIINDLIHSALIWATHVDWREVTDNLFDGLDKSLTIFKLVLLAKAHPGAQKQKRVRKRKGMHKR
ncbi:hypothetical protein MKY98_26745 [Paenibacillus sp. FSL M8-0228]|jgi:hypothetical protein|uniref:hypothetical protein n=1 Tax=Paenibacillus TaxID=44249 RepID=UPI00083E2D00|nr:hypothetical protein [Paenibacillus polymyxa]MBO3287568.1 hypothetical protein [Paenibacillus polymyxa]ODB54939.1 hypothetical protein A7311_20905 [Paenibacillus polymyxa]